MKVLYIEDDAYLSYNITKLMRKSNVSVHSVSNTVNGWNSLHNHEYDVILLDYKLAEGLSSNFITKIRRSNEVFANVPILILSALSDINSKVGAITLGADDYITKPFSNIELITRLYALVRRRYGHCTNEIFVGDIRIDLASGKVYIRDIQIELTDTEYNIVKYLCLHPGIVNKEMLLNYLYKEELRSKKVIDVFICKLRAKIALAINDNDEEAIIKTVWGRGYEIAINAQKQNKLLEKEMHNIPIISC